MSSHTDLLRQMDDPSLSPVERAQLHCRLARELEEAGRFSDALTILTQAAHLFEASNNHAIKGEFHMSLARVLRDLGTMEHREDYIDRALVEYTAASFHLEKAGHTSYRASVEDNQGCLYFALGRFKEAHEHLDRARRLFASLNDDLHFAQVEETRARVLLAEGRNAEAERVAREAVYVLEESGTPPPLPRALVTHGTALARLHRHEPARDTLERARAAAHQAGNTEDAARAELALIEELGSYLTAGEMRTVYERADQILANLQDAAMLARLRVCARRVLAAERATSHSLSVQSFIYTAPQTAVLLREAHRAALTNHTLLISGETGTGKEVLAHMIHEWSGRAGAFVTINCSTLYDPTIESQLFGHRRGSFDEAGEDYPGAVRRAAGGTLFLDEIAELSVSGQGKLLRLIDYGEIHSLGAPTPERINVRIIASTNHHLKDEVAEGRFREELFYRLQTFHFEIPPLRERTEDIPAIAEHLIRRANERYGQRVTFTKDALETIERLPLKGNVRELEALIERLVLTAVEGAGVKPEDVDRVALRQLAETGLAAASWEGCSLEGEVLRYERELIRRALEDAKGSVTRAARLLGITHQGLAFILQGRQQELLEARKPVKPRRHSIMGTARRKRQK